ncbi:MAG: hypothetical protein JNJ50_05690 [Acidobacteria bacterium]|nr:hypothetical protein [Acidobacteriota bacterium]
MKSDGHFEIRLIICAIAGGLVAGVALDQALKESCQATHQGGWFAIPRDWLEELGVSRRERERAIHQLEHRGLLEWRFSEDGREVLLHLNEKLIEMKISRGMTSKTPSQSASI